MVTDFPDYQEKYGVTPSQIREQAEEPGIGANEVAVLAGDLQADGRRVGATIEGAPAEGTIGTVVNQSAEARQLAVDGLYAVALIKEFAGKAEEFDTEVEAINTLLHQRIGAARSQARQDAPAGEDPAPVNESAIKADLQPRYNRAEEALDTAADNAQTAFTNAEANGPSDAEVRRLMVAGLISLDALPLFPGVTLTDEQRVTAIRNGLSFMTPEEQAEYVRTHPDFPPQAAGAVGPEAQRILATDVGNDIQAAAEDAGAIDAETVRILGLFQQQESFATALYEDVTPNEMADAILNLNYELFGVGEDRDGDQFPGTAQAQLDIYDKFMNAAGVSLATYTRTMSSDQGNDSEAVSLANSWVNAITDPNNPENAAALTLLMREGGEAGGEFNATFIDHVASGVLDWERSHDGDPVWGPKAQEAGVWIRDPDKVDINEWHDAYHDQDNYSFDGGMSTDGMANLLAAMGESPEGAQRFFMNSDGSVDQDRLQYLMVDRTFSESAHSDEGDGLGEALKAAIVGGVGENPGDWNQTEADRLANDMFTKIADNSGTGDGFGPDGKWHIWPDMADDLGVIGAGYRDDIYDIIDGGRADQLRLSLDQLDKVLGEIGRGDKTGIETLSAAVMIEGNDRIFDRIEEWQREHPGQPLTMEALAGSGLAEILDGRGQTNGQILGHILNKSVLVDLDDEELAETRAQYISKAVDIAGGFLPGAGSVLGEQASEFSKNLYDLAQGEGLDLLKSAVEVTPSAEDYRQDSRDGTERAIEYGIINQLIRGGYLGDQDTGPGVDHAIPGSLLVDGPNGSQVVNPDVYNAELNSDGELEIGEPGEYTAAEIRQMRTDWDAWLNRSERDIAEAIAGAAQDGFDREVNKGP